MSTPPEQHPRRQRPPSSGGSSGGGGSRFGFLDRMRGAIATTNQAHVNQSPQHQHPPPSQQQQKQQQHPSLAMTMDIERSNSADRPIDLTRVQEDDAQPQPQPTTPMFVESYESSDEEDDHEGNDDDSDDDSYIPESLASYVAEANQKLEATQNEFWNSVHANKSNDDTVVTVPGSAAQIREDDEDRKLKGEILDKLDDHHNHDTVLSPDLLISPLPPNPAHGVTESEVKRRQQQRSTFKTPAPPPQQPAQSSSLSKAAAAVDPFAPTPLITNRSNTAATATATAGKPPAAAADPFAPTPVITNRSSTASATATVGRPPTAAAAAAAVDPFAPTTSVAFPQQGTLPAGEKKKNDDDPFSVFSTATPAAAAAVNNDANTAKDPFSIFETGTAAATAPSPFAPTRMEKESMQDSTDVQIGPAPHRVNKKDDHDVVVATTTEERSTGMKTNDDGVRTEAATGVLQEEDTLTEGVSTTSGPPPPVLVAKTPQKKSAVYLGDVDETTTTPSPLSMSSPIMMSSKNNRRTSTNSNSNKPNRVSSIGGGGRGPVVPKNLAARLAAGAKRTGAPPPTPDDTTVTGPQAVASPSPAVKNKPRQPPATAVAAPKTPARADKMESMTTPSPLSVPSALSERSSSNVKLGKGSGQKAPMSASAPASSAKKVAAAPTPSGSSVSSTPPRFSPPKKQPKPSTARFTAASAERLSRPLASRTQTTSSSSSLSKSQGTPLQQRHPVSKTKTPASAPPKKQPKAKFTSASAERLSRPRGPPPKLTSPPPAKIAEGKEQQSPIPAKANKNIVQKPSNLTPLKPTERASNRANKTPPPSAEKSHPKAHFTYQTVERLYKPHEKKTPPPPPQATLPVSSTARFTAQSAERLSKPRSVVEKVQVASHSHSPPPPPKIVAPPVQEYHPPPPINFTPEVADRLARPTVAWTAAHSPPCVVQKPSSSPPRPSPSNGLRQSPPSNEASMQSPPPNKPTPPPRFTAASAERLSRPTASRAAAIEAVMHMHEQDAVTEKAVAEATEVTGHTPNVRALKPSSHLLQPTEASEAHHRPQPEAPRSAKKASSGLYPSSQLLQPTEASEAHHRSPQVRPPPPRKRHLNELGQPAAEATVGGHRPQVRPPPPRQHTLNPSSHLRQPTESSAAHRARPPPPRNQHLNPSSHLLQPTESSEAHRAGQRKQVMHPPPPRKVIVSGVPDHFMLPTASSQVGTDGNTKAKTKAAHETTRRQSVQPESRRKPTAEQGIALAQERVRQQRLREHKNGLETEKHTANHLKRSGSRDESSGHRRPPSSGRPLTVPRSPKFATLARHGKPPGFAWSSNKNHTLAESVGEFGKGLREDMSTGSGSSSQKKALTIATTPKFATTTRRGKPNSEASSDKPTLAQNVGDFGKQLRSDTGSVGSASSSQKRQLTIPQGPKFATDSRYVDKAVSKAETSLAQSTDFLRQGLRGPYKPPVKRHKGPTIPQAPRFHSSHRTLPKSAAEIEQEEMEFHRTHPFKARPMPSDRRSSLPATQGSAPLPSFMRPKTAGYQMRSQGTPTDAPQRQLMTDPRAKPGEIKTRALFKARPAPISTHQSPLAISPSHSPPTPTEPFNLSDKNSKHAAMKEASRRKAEQLAREKQAHAEQRENLRKEAIHRQHEKNRKLEEAKHRRTMAQLGPHVIPQERKLTQPKPFKLASDKRHEAAAEKLRSKLLEDEEKRRRRALFLAKPIPESTYVYKPPPPRAPLELVDPFSPFLQSRRRADERKEFDEHAEREREAAAAQARNQQEQLLVEEKADLSEKRRLPVSEGGLIPTAQPINAVFWNNK